MDTTLKALLKYAKFETEPNLTWKGLRDNVLAEIYHPDMTLENVLQVCLTAYQYAAAEPRFELAFRHDPMRHLMVAPLDYIKDPWSDKTTWSIEGFYDVIILRLMIELRLTRVDWCADELTA